MRTGFDFEKDLQGNNSPKIKHYPKKYVAIFNDLKEVYIYLSNKKTNQI